MSLIKHISDKLIYCYYKYAVTGLLVIPQNILVNDKDNTDIKFSHFLSGLAMNSTAIKNKDHVVNYVDGIDSKHFLKL